MKKLTPQEIWVNYIIPALEEKPVPDDALEVLKHAKLEDFKGMNTSIDVNRCLEIGIRFNKTNKTMAALLAGADTKTPSDGNTPVLDAAAAYGNIDIVEMLLNHGAYLECRNIKGDTPLIVVSRNGYTEIAKLLLARGADVNAKNKQGFSPLLEAASRGEINLAALLLEHGAEVNAQCKSTRYPDEDCFTSLHTASANWDIGLVALLLANGADVNIKDSNDFTALDDALDMYHYDTAKLLQFADQLETYNNLPKPLIYASAALAAKNGLDIGAFVERQEKLFKQTYQHLYPPHKAYNMLNPRPDYQTWLQQQADKLGVTAYTELDYIMDMVSEVANAIILPQLLPKNNSKAKSLSDDKIERFQEHSLSIAAAQLFSRLTLPEILTLSDAWHYGKAISTNIRDLKTGEWQALMEPYIYNKVNPPLTIVALTNSDALRDETALLKHCVGRGGYDDGCLKGNHHILSVRTMEGEPLATIWVDENLNIINSQFRGKHNLPPPKEAKAAFDELKKAFENNRNILNKPAHGTWGETERSIQLLEEANISDLERTIGYRLEERDTKLQACIDHYHHELKHKQSYTKEERRPTLGMQTKKIEERSVMPFNLPSLRLDRDTIADIKPLLTKETKSILNAQKHLIATSNETKDSSSTVAR